LIVSDGAVAVLDASEREGPPAFGPTISKAAALDVADLLAARGRQVTPNDYSRPTWISCASETTFGTVDDG
jgi:hypothetical protein